MKYAIIAGSLSSCEIYKKSSLQSKFYMTTFYLDGVDLCPGSSNLR